MALDFEVRGNIALITLSRSQARNAISPEMFVKLRRAMLEIRDDANIHVVVITGKGKKAFCAGADLKLFVPLATGARQPVDEWDHELLKLIKTRAEEPLILDLADKPVISAINGDAIAGGMELVQSSDIRIAVPEARFGLQEVKFGIYPTGGSTFKLSQQIPFPKAMELLLTGNLMSAKTASELHFLNYVVPREQLLNKAMELAEEIASYSPIAVQQIRKGVKSCIGLPDEAARKVENDHAAVVFRSKGAKDGPKVFVDKKNSND